MFQVIDRLLNKKSSRSFVNKAKESQDGFNFINTTIRNERAHNPKNTTYHNSFFTAFFKPSVVPQFPQSTIQRVDLYTDAFGVTGASLAPNVKPYDKQYR